MKSVHPLIPLKRIKKTLEQRRTLLHQELTKEKLPPHPRLNESQDYEEIYVEDLNQGIELEIDDHRKAEVRAINEALKCIVDGRYGICEDCDGPINIERLKAFPMTKRCIECETIYEHYRKKEQISPNTRL